jgi:hypothetical protein
MERLPFIADDVIARFCRALVPSSFQSLGQVSNSNPAFMEMFRGERHLLQVGIALQCLRS